MSAIEFKQVEKSFKDGDSTIEALKETNFSVEKGEFVAIIGPSGSGKSTFLTIAGGLQAPSKGEVLINDEDFSEKKEKERAKLETNIEKIRQQQKEKEERKISITDNELKKITSLAKAEQALNLFENNFDTLKANKAVIRGDANLKVRVEILRNRFNDFIDSLD